MALGTEFDRRGSILRESMSLLAIESEEEVPSVLLRIKQTMETLEIEMIQRTLACEVVDWLMKSTGTTNMNELKPKLLTLASRLESMERDRTVSTIQSRNHLLILTNDYRHLRLK